MHGYLRAFWYFSHCTFRHYSHYSILHCVYIISISRLICRSFVFVFGVCVREFCRSATISNTNVFPSLPAIDDDNYKNETPSHSFGWLYYYYCYYSYSLSIQLRMQRAREVAWTHHLRFYKADCNSYMGPILNNAKTVPIQLKFCGYDLLSQIYLQKIYWYNFNYPNSIIRIWLSWFEYPQLIVWFCLSKHDYTILFIRNCLFKFDYPNSFIRIWLSEIDLSEFDYLTLNIGFCLSKSGYPNLAIQIRICLSKFYYSNLIIRNWLSWFVYSNKIIRICSWLSDHDYPNLIIRISFPNFFIQTCLSEFV